jgi:phosphatidylglycerophosphatase A
MPRSSFPHSIAPNPSSAVPSGAPIETQREEPRPARRSLLVLAIATGLGVGFAPIAPGTFGAALALPIFVLFSPVPALLALTWGALVALGIWAADQAESAFGRADDGRIVIDEVAGQLLALAPLLAVPSAARTNLPALVTGFVAFRLFDIWKPGPVRWAERRFSGGTGVMADDLVAGALAALVVAAGLAAGVLA